MTVIRKKLRPVSKVCMLVVCFFIYHNESINTTGGSLHRSVCIDRLYYREDGTMERVWMTTEGEWGEG